MEHMLPLNFLKKTIYPDFYHFRITLIFLMPKFILIPLTFFTIRKDIEKKCFVKDIISLWKPLFPLKFIFPKKL